MDPDIQENSPFDADAATYEKLCQSVAGGDTLTRYIRESRHAVLTQEEEYALALRVQQGDQEARDELVGANLRLVIALARTHSYGSRERMLDLIQEGNVGLIQAVDRFEPQQGFRFSTFATAYIRGFMFSALESQPIIKISPAKKVFLREMRQAALRFLAQKHREPTAKELAECLGVPVGDVVAAREDTLYYKSLDQPLPGEDTTLGEMLSDFAPTDSDNWVNDQHAIKITGELLDALDNRPYLREIIELSWGIGQSKGREYTPDAIAKILGLPTTQVIKKLALATRIMKKWGQQRFQGQEP